MCDCKVKKIERLRKSKLPGIAHVAEIERLDSELEVAKNRIEELEPFEALSVALQKHIKELEEELETYRHNALHIQEMMERRE
jgi:hypothetical protein